MENVIRRPTIRIADKTPKSMKEVGQEPLNQLHPIKENLNVEHQVQHQTQHQVREELLQRLCKITVEVQCLQKRILIGQQQLHQAIKTAEEEVEALHQLLKAVEDPQKINHPDHLIQKKMSHVQAIVAQAVQDPIEDRR